jgi:hypothetical protein
MITLALQQADIDLILFALKRLEQDESATAQPMTQQAAQLLASWQWIILDDHTENSEEE